MRTWFQPQVISDKHLLYSLEYTINITLLLRIKTLKTKCIIRIIILLMIFFICVLFVCVSLLICVCQTPGSQPAVQLAAGAYWP